MKFQKPLELSVHSWEFLFPVGIYAYQCQLYTESKTNRRPAAQQCMLFMSAAATISANASVSPTFARLVM
jgi:hypothetical protein